MGKIHALMDIGKRSMMNSQTALQTVSHNIANKTTEGYSRQRVEQVTAPSITEGNLQIGQGSRAAAVTRINNPFLDKQLNGANREMGFLKGQAETLGRVEQIFNEQQNKSLNQYVSDFFNSFRELSNNPESTTVRTIVKETAEALSKDFTRIDQSLLTVQKDTDFQLSARVEEINGMTTEIADLNQKIASIEIANTTANDERDRRELLVKKINELVDIRVSEGDAGMLNISTAGNALLVTGFDSVKLLANDDPSTGRMEIFAAGQANAQDIKITDRIKGGLTGGLLSVRDKVIKDVREKMDRLAYTIADQVNQAHTLGYDRTGRDGVEFFAPLESVEGAARNLQLNKTIASDVSRIAAGAKRDAPGDNTVANVISRIQYKQVFDGGTATMDDFYNSQVGKMGVITNQANKSFETQGNIVKQIEKLRESVAGVSLDEEATKMIEFQKAFDASARLIRVAEEMFDTVLSLKRM